MEKQRTAIAQSIARKKERVTYLEQQSHGDSISHSEYVIFFDKIMLLRSEITEDENLLSTEEEQMHDAASFWWESGQSRIEVDFKQWFTETFKND